VGAGLGEGELGVVVCVEEDGVECRVWDRGARRERERDRDRDRATVFCVKRGSRGICRGRERYG
jgi:hypothetical protein